MGQIVYNQVFVQNFIENRCWRKQQQTDDIRVAGLSQFNS